MNIGAVGLIESRRWIVGGRFRLHHGSKTISIARREQMRIRRKDLRSHLFKGRDVIKNPESAAVSGEHQIVKVFLNRNPIDGHVREIIPGNSIKYSGRMKRVIPALLFFVSWSCEAPKQKSDTTPVSVPALTIYQRFIPFPELSSNIVGYEYLFTATMLSYNPREG
jgi:hypothetical protein